MIINDSFPKFDLPIDFIADDSITRDILNYYSNFPCKIKAGVFVLCTEGMVKATINLLEVVIRKNDFVIVLPNSFIQIHEVSSDTRISFAGFSSDFMLSGNYVEILLDSMPMILNSPVISLQDDIAGLYRNVYLLLIRAYTLPHSLENKDIIRSILAIFLQGTKELYRQFIQLLMAHYTSEHEVAFYAEKCGVTAAHFSSAIRRASGYSPLAIITEIIIMNAKAQLKTTRLPVKEIAFSLGFNNHSFFNKYFRKQVKMTPLEYREK